MYIDSRQQLAVWHGQERWDPNAAQCPIGRVLMYPVEYNSYAASLARLTTRPQPPGTPPLKEFHIADHLGSVRVAFDSLGRGITTDYEPFGAIAYTTSFGLPFPARQTFIDKEKDGENGLGDFGVRKYEEETGRFMSVDRLWEKYHKISSFVYAANMPTIAVDKDGKELLVVGDAAFAADVNTALGEIVRSATGRAIYLSLKLSKTKYYIAETKGPELADMDGHVIYWNPRTGYFNGDNPPKRDESGVRYPPFMGLAHELIHQCVRSRVAAEDYNASRKPGTSVDGESRHEVEVISWTNVIAKDLGYRYRTSHAGVNYVTKSVRSAEMPDEGNQPLRGPRESGSVESLNP